MILFNLLDKRGYIRVLAPKDFLLRIISKRKRKQGILKQKGTIHFFLRIFSYLKKKPIVKFCTSWNFIFFLSQNLFSGKFIDILWVTQWSNSSKSTRGWALMFNKKAWHEVHLKGSMGLRSGFCANTSNLGKPCLHGAHFVHRGIARLEQVPVTVHKDL